MRGKATDSRTLGRGRPASKYLQRASTAGIDRTVLFAAFHSNYAFANREVARIVASRPGRFLGFAFVHPERDRGRVFAMTKVAVEQYAFSVSRFTVTMGESRAKFARLLGPFLYRCFMTSWVKSLSSSY
jgi:uncharacterized protein